ncbi:MAG: biotin/lipoyl-binding protein [Candidatus Omnitrophica bacterium]|nr:biotin/lipoyl-binding protein [Candidatus Omnitrophota bacterium]
MANVTLPELGEGIKSAVVSFWHVDKENRVGEGDDIVEMATDKATFNVPSPVAGTIREIMFQEGDTVQVGDTLAVIEE